MHQLKNFVSLISASATESNVGPNYNRQLLFHYSTKFRALLWLSYGLGVMSQGDQAWFIEAAVGQSTNGMTDDINFLLFRFPVGSCILLRRCMQMAFCINQWRYILTIWSGVNVGRHVLRKYVQQSDGMLYDILVGSAFIKINNCNLQKIGFII